MSVEKLEDTVNFPLLDFMLNETNTTTEEQLNALTFDECLLPDNIESIFQGNDTLASEACPFGYLVPCLEACQQEDCKGDETSAVDLAFTVLIQVLVFALVFGLAGSVDFGHFKQRFRSRGVYIGLLCQFFLMPLIGFLTVWMFDNVLDLLFAITLLIICSSPGGSYSNWWCNLINADLALSVAMTTVSTILSCAFLPLNIILYIEFGYKKLHPDASDEIVKLLPYETIGITLANVISAVVLGLLFGYKFPQMAKKANLFGTICGFISIALGVFASSTSCAKPWELDFVIYVAVAVPCILGLFLAMGFATIANLPKPQRVAVSIETAYQNTGIALAVALSLGARGRAAAVVPVVYGGYEAVFFGMFAIFSWYIGWTLSPADEKLWVILFKDYQDTIPNHPHYKGYHGDDNAELPSDRLSLQRNAQVSVELANDDDDEKV